MKTDVASLQIKVESRDAALATKRLDNLENQSKKTDRASDSLRRGYGRLERGTKTLNSGTKRLALGLGSVVGALGGVAIATAGLRKLVDVTVQFQRLEGQLFTATGSLENAAVAMEGVQAFAARTPYDLAQATEAFVKLTNLGLDPSSRALTAYGDLASAMGKTLSDAIEAAADAATGEFERLKEFGIKASSQGDQVEFTFRGIKTTVQKEAAEIEKYLLGLSETNFGGAMARQMDTLGGAISNFGDQWDIAFYNISQQGIGDALESTVRIGISALEELNAQLASGQLQASINANLAMFQGYGRDLSFIFNGIAESHGESMDRIENGTETTLDIIIQELGRLPVNAREVMGRVGIEIGTIVGVAQEATDAALRVWEAFFEYLLRLGRAQISELKDILNPFDGDTFDFGAATAGALDDLNRKALAATKDLTTGIEDQTNARAALIDSQRTERIETLAGIEEEKAAADSLRETYDDLQSSKAGDSDPLAQFGQGAGSGAEDPSGATGQGAGASASGGASGGSRGGGGAGVRDAGQERLERLVEELRTEEERIQESYERRNQIILDNTTAGSDQQIELQRRVLEEYENDLDRMTSTTGLHTQERYDLYGYMYDGIATLAHSNNEELEGIARAALVVQKGIAIYQATIKTYEMAVSAYSALAGIPVVGPALGAAAAGAAIAFGAAQIAAITSAPEPFEHGGMIGAGSVGIVGEAGPELVRGPAQITSARTTAGLQGGTAGESNIIINNFNGSSVKATRRQTPDGSIVEIAIRKAKGEIAGDIRDGRGPIADAISGTYGLKRA